MKLKKICAVICCAVIMLFGCSDPAVWDGNVAVVGDVYLSEAEYEDWYEQMKLFDTIMPDTICSMLGVEGDLRPESGVLAFARYRVITQLYGQADEISARAFLRSLDLKESQENMDCAIVYCTIDACRKELIDGVEVTQSMARDWYNEQVDVQSTLAKNDLASAQRAYVQGDYEVTVYVPEGLKIVQALGVSCAQHDRADAFSVSQSAWRKLLYGEGFDAMYEDYNELDACANADGTQKTFCIFEGWDAEPAIALCSENLDQPGQMCGPTLYGDAYWIVKLVSIPASGVIDFELVEQQCMAAAQKRQMRLDWYDALQAMQDEAGVRFAPYR
ncbi:MAG: hypothetical protein J6L88_08695 [Clostridia bacterium]|nr:hypothetical protein [Clostridia bacterium]